MIRALAEAGAADAEAADGRPDAAPAPTSTLYCSVGDVTNLAVATRPLLPLHPRLPGRPRGHRRRPRLDHRAEPEHAAHVARARRPRAPGRRRSRATRRRRADAHGARARRRQRWSTSCASRSTSTAPRRARCRSSRIVLCGPGSAIPGLAEQMEPAIGLPIALARPAGARRLRRRDRRAPDPAPRTRPRALAMRPVNLIPAEERPGGRRPLRSGPLAYIVVGALAAAVIALTALVVTEGTISDTQGRSRPAAKPNRRASKPRPRHSPPTPSSTPSANSAWRRSPASPTAASTGSG